MVVITTNCGGTDLLREKRELKTTLRADEL